MEAIFNIPDEKIDRIATAVDKMYPGTPGASPAKRIANRIRLMLIDMVRRSEASEAAQAATDEIIADESLITFDP